MNALLCLLSAQHVPNLLSVHHLKPDQLVLVESTGMKGSGAAGRFLEALALGGLDYSARCHVEPLEAEDNIEAVGQALRRAYGRFPTAHWTANVTGGTKPMSLATFEFFRALGERIIYMNANRPNVIIDVARNGSECCTYQPSIGEFLAGYGFKLQKPERSVEEAEKRAESWEAAARAIAATGGRCLQLQVDPQDRKRARSKGLELDDHLRISAPEIRRVVGRALNLRHEDEVLKGKVNRHGGRFLTGEWLEVFMWNQFRRYRDELGLWDVRLGLEVGHAETDSLNELDVAFMRNWELWVVECKTGAQEHDSGGDVLYKLEAVISQFRALRVRSVLATTSENILDDRGEIKGSVRARAAISGCRLIRGDDIAEMAKRFEDAEALKNTLSVRA